MPFSLFDFHMVVISKIWAKPRLRWASLAVLGAVALAAAIAIQSLSAVSPLGGQSPVSETGSLPSALKPGLFGPPAPGKGSVEEVLEEREALIEVAGLPISNAGPAARAFAFRGSALNRERAIECMAMAVYYEAASEGVKGQQAVAQVVLNRVAHPAYPAGVCDVVFEGSERVTGCQFSFTCDGSLARKPNKYAWLGALDVAKKAIGGQVFADVGLATHYHTHAVRPHWAPNLRPLGAIGEHRFYRWPGRAGTPAAFTMRYSGLEHDQASYVAARSGRPNVSNIADIEEVSDMRMDLSALPETESPLTEALPDDVGTSSPVAAAAKPAPKPTRITADQRRGDLKQASGESRLKVDETAGSLKAGAGTLREATD
ncbi:cell wall hydrolase [Qipengyuania atrilutea]|nr:cell wall hydrolase [Actirhodobacter atriluteus]